MIPFFKKLPLTKLDLLVLIIISFLGIINLATPFGGDQALFITGAQEIANGNVLYRDFWDYKPPGIYYFYYIAGSIFGFTEVGIHFFELLLWLAFSVFLIISLRTLNSFENKNIVSFAPIFTAGIYFSLSSIFTLTQVEGIINGFLYLTLFLSIASTISSNNKSKLIFFSGLTGSIVLTFKLMFLPIIGMFWLSTFINLIFIRKENFRFNLRKFVLPLLLGFFIPIIILFAYYAKMGLLDIVYKTFFVYPPRLIAEIPLGGYSKLYRLFDWYFGKFYIMIALGLFGVFVGLFYKKDLLTVNLVLWIIWGSIIIILTRISWWQYHTHLLNVPVGLLFLIAIDFFWSSIKKYQIINTWKGKIAVISILLILFYPMIKACFPKTRYSLKYMKAFSKEEKREVFESLVNDNNGYPYTYRNIEFLKSETSLKGNIFAASTPLFYYLSGRSQATPLNGWILELFLPEQWGEFIDQLKKYKPVYIFIGDKYPDLVPNLSPETTMYIKKNYSVVNHNNDGIWYVNKEILMQRELNN